MISNMSNSSTNPKPHRTAMVPVTTMEELPLLTEAERADLLVSLKEAEASVKAGQGVEHDPDTFVDRLIAIRNTAKRSKPA
jgi:hypothetical protein